MNLGMDNSTTPVIPPIPDESFNFSAPPPGTPTPAAGTQIPTSSGNGTVKQNKKISGKVIATIFGLLLLVGGVGAGIVLVQQQQIFKQKAAFSGSITNQHNFSSCNSTTCTISQSPSCANQQAALYYCPGGLTNGVCLQNRSLIGPFNAGQTINVDSYAPAACGAIQIDVFNTNGVEGGCGEVTYVMSTPTCSAGGGGTTTTSSCVSDYCAGADQCRAQGGTPGAQGTRPSGGDCATNTVMCCIPTGGGSGGASTTTTTTTSSTTASGNKACGEACSSDSECYPTGANGATERCINGVCQNTACVGKTIPGRNCDCSNLNACGQPCGAKVGLCQGGSQCGFITTAYQCLPAEGDLTKQYCLPLSPNNGYKTAQCSGIATIYLINPAGQSGTPPLTQQDVLQACAPQATPAPIAQCSAIKAYDTNWNLLTISQLSTLKVGDKVRFTVMGTTTSGNFDKARFTINGTQTPEVTGQKPGGAGEFYYEYTVPSGVTSFTVTAQIHQQQLNTWN